MGTPVFVRDHKGLGGFLQSSQVGSAVYGVAEMVKAELVANAPVHSETFSKSFRVDSASIAVTGKHGVTVRAGARIVNTAPYGGYVEFSRTSSHPIRRTLRSYRAK